MPAEELSTPAPPLTGSRLARWWVEYRGQFVLLAVLAATVLLFRLRLSGFTSVDNLVQILMRVAVIGIVAVGEFFVIVGRGIDISVGKLAAFSSVLAAQLIAAYGAPMPLAIFLALAAGAGIGSANGVLAARFGVPPFIVTLGTFSILSGVTAVWTHSASVPIADPGWLEILGRRPWPVVIMLAVFLLGWIVSARTVFGRRLYAIGGNEDAARLAGISVKLHRTVAYLIAGALAALGGIVAMSKLWVGDAKIGDGLEFDAITAVVLGGTSLFGGEGRLLGVLVGAVFMGALSTGLNQANVDSNYQNVIKGAVLVTAVLIDTALRRRGRRG